jgi:hypothetical protein
MVNISDNPVETIRQRVDQLQRNWAPREAIVKRWYRLIQLENDLAQDGMESVIGNDPRSSYNLATWLLTPKTWSVTSFKTGLSDEQVQAATSFEQMVEREVMLSIRHSRGKLNGSYLAQAVKLFVATGWICLVAAPTQPHWTINAWHPMTVFPDYAADGTLSELGRKWTVTANQANTMIFMEGWIPPVVRFNGSVIVRQWWIETPFGTLMATIMGNHLARPLGPTMFQRMPAYCQPAGGLPDDGTIISDKWRADVGQAIVASVLDLQKNYDKMLTYMQQILRDTANPKWIERVDGGDGVIKSEDMQKRGVIWTIGLGEDAWPVQPPGAPTDLRTHMFDIRNQVQRGTFSDVSFGAGDASAFLMANVTASTKQLLQPFLDTIKDANGELLTRNVALARQFNQPIGGVPVPDLPDDLILDFNYDIEIPGDFIQRANSARILNPNFRISQESLTELMFPEIKDPLDERLRLTIEDVANSEIMLTIKSIRELRRAAAQANLAGDGESEMLLVGAADKLEVQLTGLATPEGESDTFRNIVEAGS